MIISRILGGLGNQLFQYAAGYALATQNNTELKLDLSGFKDYKLRSFELSKFSLSLNPATPEECTKLKATNLPQRLKARLLPTAYKRFYKQPYFHFHPGFFSLRNPVYVQGYFQSEKYFAPVGQEIKSLYSFNKNFRREVMQTGQQLRDEESVAVHIRRGDYKDQSALTVHGILSMAYYQQAIKYLLQTKGSSAKFYLFTDDPAGLMHEALPGNPTYISGRIANNHFEDFYLMQQCRHTIIANSSFSWWAAWLNNHADKCVIAPKQWFNKGPKDTQDLLPVTWLKM